MRRREALLQSVLLLGWLASSACNSQLDTSLEHKECNRNGQCLPGYVCSEDNLCVRPSSGQNEEPTTVEPDASVADAGPVEAPMVPVGMPQPPPACSEGSSLCDGVCADLLHDFDNCGACGRQCPSTERGKPACEEGVCTLRCDDQYTLCGNACYQLATDPLHCGGCAFSCGIPTNGRALCVDSRCSEACEPGFMLCGPACTRVEIDPSNCGQCGKACAVDEQCAGGTCVKACPAGTQECARSCVDVLGDTQNCGMCGRVCTAPANSTALCQEGVCAWQCSPGLQQCSGSCYDTQTDPLHCGGCNQACPAAPARGRATCQAGMCRVECSESYTNCDGRCVSPQLIAAARQAGFGSMPPCAALAAYQDRLMCQGMGEYVMFCGDSCVNLATNRQHCGGCGRTCAANQTCVRGNCTP